jgi:formylglycine-generating enzyme required for sulfatase activity
MKLFKSNIVTGIATSYFWFGLDKKCFKMKKLIYFILVVLTITSCTTQSSNGHLIGASGRPVWYQADPYGMLYIKSGAFNMGQSDQDVPSTNNNKTKTVSVAAFYMDQTEITNNEYRQFVNWVRDSIALRLLAENIDEEQFLIKTYDDNLDENDSEKWNLNWNAKFSYSAFNPANPDKTEAETAPVLASMFLNESERFYSRKEIDTRKLRFEYYWIDLQEAARKGRVKIKTLANSEAEIDTDHREKMVDAQGNESEMPFPADPGQVSGKDYNLGFRNSKGQNNAIRGHSDRSRFIIKEIINVYPDTLCWIHDFTYANNEYMTNMYFWHPAYDEYPVVGVTWQQCNAFNVWRTQLLNTWRNAHREAYVQDFRLPSETEWEYAARGGLDNNPYPWGGPYARNSRGCFLGNFKPIRGRYMEDGGFHTVKATSYHPNDFGLYCMAGNVAEWCRTAYDESMYEYGHDMNTEYIYNALDHDPPSMKRKVIRGGSWKDIGYYLQTGTRTYEYQDTAKSYIGFRSVMNYLGRGGPNKEGDF